MGKVEEGRDNDLEEEIGNLRVHIHALDNRLSDLADKTDDDVRDFSDHLEEIIDTIEIKFRRHRAELARGTQSQDSRLAALEAQVQVLVAAIRRGDTIYADHKKRSMDALIFFHTLFLLPWTILRGTYNLVRKIVVPDVEQPVYYRRRLSRSHSSPSLRSSLASIPEEDQSTHISEDTDDQGYFTLQTRRSASPGVLMSLLLGVSKILLSPLLIVLQVAAFLIGIPKPRIWRTVFLSFFPLLQTERVISVLQALSIPVLSPFHNCSIRLNASLLHSDSISWPCISYQTVIVHCSYVAPSTNIARYLRLRLFILS